MPVDLSKYGTVTTPDEVDLSKYGTVSGPVEGSPKADFIKNPSGRDYTPKPTWFDEIQQGATGAIMNPGGAHDDPLKRFISGTGESLGRTTKAWSDALSFNPNERTAAEMIPIIGPMAVDAVNAMATPGQRLKGVGMAVSMLAPAVFRGGVPKVDVGDLRTSIQDRMFRGDPHEMATQAIKPRASKLDFTNTLKSAMPDMKAAETAPISNVQNALDTVKAAKAQNRAAYDAFRGPAYAIGTLVDLSPVADSIEGSVPHDIQFEANRGVPSAVSTMDSIRARAGAYRTKVPLEEAERQLRAANADLDAFYAKYPRQQWSALATNPETAATYAKAESLRSAIYNALDDQNAGAGAREIQARYGKLLDIENELQRRQNVAARQQPQSLSQQLSKAQAFGKLALAGGKLFIGRDPLGAAGSALESAGVKAASDWMKEQQATNALLSRAFRTYKVPQSPFPVPAPVNLARLLEAGPIRMPAGAESPIEGYTGYPAGEWERQGFVPKQLPPASSRIGVSGVIVPDIIGRSSRGQGTPYRLLGPASSVDGTPYSALSKEGAGAVRLDIDGNPLVSLSKTLEMARQRIAARRLGVRGVVQPVTDVSGPGGTIPVLSSERPIPLPKVGNPLGLDEWGRPVRPPTANRSARRATTFVPETGAPEDVARANSMGTTLAEELGLPSKNPYRDNPYRKKP